MLGNNGGALAADDVDDSDDACANSGALEPQMNAVLQRIGYDLSPSDGDLQKIWKLQDVRRGLDDDTCLLIAEECISYFGEIFCEEARIEVLAIDEGETVVPFEQAVEVPPALKVAIGKHVPDYVYDAFGNESRVWDSDLYYAELEGASAIAAYKSIEAGIDRCGFFADISSNNGQPDGKLAFDPTPGRSWKVSAPAYDLNRGQSGETYDVRPVHLDSNFDAAFRGSAGYVAPWGSCFLRRYYDGDADAWLETGVKERAGFP